MEQQTSSSTLTIEQFKTMPLPVIQRKFVDQYTGLVDSILRFPNLPLILNPCFSYHYFFISGTTDENTITTKDTTREMEPNGLQTQEMEINAYLLSAAIKKEFMGIKEHLYIYRNASYTNVAEYIPYLNNVHGKLFVKSGDYFIRIPGLTTKNIGKAE